MPIAVRAAKSGICSVSRQQRCRTQTTYCILGLCNSVYDPNELLGNELQVRERQDTFAKSLDGRLGGDGMECSVEHRESFDVRRYCHVARKTLPEKVPMKGGPLFARKLDQESDAVLLV